MTDQNTDRSRNAVQAVFILVFVAALIMVVTYLLSKKTTSSVHNVELVVEASGGFSIITFEAGSVSISKSTTVTTPWQKTLKLHSGTTVYLTASNPTQTGELFCSILLDSQAWKKAKTDAPKDGVACAGIVP